VSRANDDPPDGTAPSATAICANSRMMALGPPPIERTGNAAQLDPRLASIVADGFHEVADCVVLARFRASATRTSVASCRDRTGFEAFINHVHVDHELGLPHSHPVALVQAGRLAERLAGRLEQVYRDDRFMIIVAVSDSCTLRFHKLRTGESWIASDIESYRDEGVMTIPVPRVQAGSA
jgi:hypothetical protein